MCFAQRHHLLACSNFAIQNFAKRAWPEPRNPFQRQFKLLKCVSSPWLHSSYAGPQCLSFISPCFSLYNILSPSWQHKEQHLSTSYLVMASSPSSSTQTKRRANRVTTRPGENAQNSTGMQLPSSGASVQQLADGNQDSKSKDGGGMFSEKNRKKESSKLASAAMTAEDRATEYANAAAGAGDPQER